MTQMTEGHDFLFTKQIDIKKKLGRSFTLNFFSPHIF